MGRLQGRNGLLWAKKILPPLNLLWRAIKKFFQDEGLFLSSGIAFNLLLCLIPLILLMLALAGSYLYTDREILNHIRRYLERMVPSFDPKIMRNILTVVRDRKIVGVLGIGGLLWTSTWVFGSLRTALNIVFQVKKGRGFLRGIAVDLLLILLVGFLFLISMTLTSIVTHLQGLRLSLLVHMGPIFGFLLSYLLPFIFTFWMFFFVYKIAPFTKIHFRTALRAALFTSLVWEVAKQLFGWYILHLGRFSMLYGSLSTLVISFVWIYFSSVILVLGGEVAFLMERDRSPNGTVEKRRG